jgi:hypothetical protein
MAAEAPLQNKTNDRQPIASIRHTIVLLLIFAILTLAGALFQSRPSNESASTPQGRGSSMLYISLIIMELLLFIMSGLGCESVGILHCFKSWAADGKIGKTFQLTWPLHYHSGLSGS